MRLKDEEEPGCGGEFLARQLKRCRKRLGLTQTELAQEAGVSLSLYAKLESQHAYTTRRSVERIARKLGVTADFLLTGKEGTSRALMELQAASPECLRGIAKLVSREDIKRLAAEVSTSMGTDVREARAIIIRCMLLDTSGRMVTDGPIPTREEWERQKGGKS